jgi:asparagine synthase (glutamine-hydrolysing)
MQGELVGTDTLKEALGKNGLPMGQADDARLALLLFERDGLQAISDLHGIFVIAIWDTRKRQLVIANDRFGLRPVFYTHDRGRLAFAEEIKGLLPLDFVRREADDAAIADFLAYDYILGDKTLFRDIRLLPPASVLTYQDGTLTIRPYWSLEYRPDSTDRSEDDLVEEFVFRLEEAVKRRIRGSSSVGLPLSGGLDSATLLAVLTQRLGEALPTYTYGLPGYRDIHLANRIANLSNVPHHKIYLAEDYLSERADATVSRSDGLLNCVSSHGFSLLTMSEQCEVMMLGNGGDSFFQTIRTYFGGLSGIEGEPIHAYFQTINHQFREEELANLLTSDYYGRIRGRAFTSLQAAFDELEPNSIDNILDAHHLREHQRRYTLQGLSTINHRMEYSEPYYDYDLVDFALSLPERMRCKRRIHKMALSWISPALAEAIDLNRHSGGRQRSMGMRGFSLPFRFVRRLRRRLGTLNRPTSGFTDVGYLLRTANRRWAEDILLDPRTQGRGYFRQQSLRELIDDHMNGGRNLGRQLGALITLELWHRQFVD